MKARADKNLHIKIQATYCST